MVPAQTSREDTLHEKPAGVRISTRHPAGSEAVVEGFEPPLAFTPNIISSDAPSAARTHHQQWKTIAHPQQESKKNHVRQPGVAPFTAPFTVPFSTPDTEVPATSTDPNRSA